VKRYLPVLFIALPLALGGCDTLSAAVGMYGGQGGLDLLTQIEQGADKVEDVTLGNAMKALPQYCKVPAATRKLFRDRIDARKEAEGNLIGVWCKGDPVLTLGPTVP
jgi:hypothetical protein